MFSDIPSMKENGGLWQGIYIIHKMHIYSVCIIYLQKSYLLFYQKNSNNSENLDNLSTSENMIFTMDILGLHHCS